MDALMERLNSAKNSNAELESLIADYMPFIKRTVSDAANLSTDYDDRLSLAMLTFMNCVRQYDMAKGSFMGFAAVCIRNRLIDESRRQIRYAGRVIPLYTEEDESASASPEELISLAAYDKELERRHLLEEIELISEHLGEYGIAFKELPRICPKQERARLQCINLSRYVAGNIEMRNMLFKQRRLMQSLLAKQFGLSEKTIEKHRKYIVTIVVILVGDYPYIRAFLPQYKL